ncbi:MAG: DUF1028 domain-containing protein, partial [Anaerolineaceae bacterium]
MRPKRFPFAHTFSIVARDPNTREMGVAVQSHWFSTGSVVTWAEPGVGAVATQSMVEVSYGPLGLLQMQQKKTASQALRDLLEKDANREVRQVAMVDANGNIAVHTGKRCIAEAGHQTGRQFSVQANMMLKPTVWSAMAAAYETATGSLAERMLSALDAAQSEGGDVRGMQSAALLIVSGESNLEPWKGVLVDLRVEDHPEPLVELRRLYNTQLAYEYMNKGDDLLSKGDADAAFTAYDTAANLAPHLLELPFWQAVTLIETGREEQAFPILKKVISAEPDWLLLIERLPAAGLLRD